MSLNSLRSSGECKKCDPGLSLKVPRGVPASPKPEGPIVVRRSGKRKLAGEDRTEFARDRDRLIYSSAFRRLAGKAQVVASTELGSFHNRLTHSLKVAQLGRRVAETLQAKAPTKTTAGYPDTNLVEFACLAHDLGHPPFGHIGEQALGEALDELAARESKKKTIAAQETARMELGGFEGNAQSIRIVTRLAQHLITGDNFEAISWFGLDLTSASIDATMKYPWERPSSASPKWGIYPGDREAAQWARETNGASTGEHQPKSFECSLMDWCDDVAYATHDMEDFYRSGHIPLARLFTVDESEEYQYLMSYLRAKWTESGDWPGDDLVKEEWLTLVELIAVPGSYDGTALRKRTTHHIISQLITNLTKEVAYQDLPYLHSGTFLISPDAERAKRLEVRCNLLKGLIWRYVIDNPQLATQQAGHRRIIKDLVNAYDEDEQLLPRDYQEMLQTREAATGYSNETHAKLRAIADHVSSLTEPSALLLHRRVTGIDPGSLSDRP